MTKQIAAISVLMALVTAFGKPLPETKPKALSSIRVIPIHPQRQNPVSLNELFAKGERIVLNFVSANCQHSLAQLESIKAAFQNKDLNAQKGKNSSVFAIVFVGKKLTEIKNFLKNETLPTLVLWDRSGDLAKSLKIKVTPTVAVLSKDYRLVRSYEGFSPNDSKAYREFFERLMKAVIQGTPLPPRPTQFSIGGDSGCGPSG